MAEKLLTVVCMNTPSLFGRSALLLLCGLAPLGGCGRAGDDVVELAAAPEPGKEDGVGRAALPVNGDYGTTMAWQVKNQWEDRDTPEARKAGLAWDAGSGLSWDEKYAKWVGSLEIIPSAGSGWYTDTIQVSTPWGKTLPSPKLDCADATIMLRASFAAWYNLPFYMVAGGNPVVYFGHFGIRTASGPWDQTVLLAQAHKDFSATPPADPKAWPKDGKLRALHLHGKNADGSYQDEMPYVVAKGEGTGAYLDELHLNKRAARLIYYMQLYMGSQNVVDTNNTYNLQPEALRTGDTMMYRRAPQGTGHTMVVVRLRSIEGGKLEAQDIFGNEPPDQLYVESPGATRNNFMSEEGGGASLSEDGKTPYSHIGGGLKRWRVAKNVAGKWTNTWMNADKASWIDSTDYPRIEARPKQLAGVLGELSPLGQRNELLQQIEAKREHLRDNPSSCSARERREAMFAKLYDLMSSNWDWSREEVDARYRILEDYVYAPLDYTTSRTCCWNSSNRQMHETIMEYATSLQDKMCALPPVFMQTDGTFGAYAKWASDHGKAFPAWRADEECPPAASPNDVATAQDGLVTFCALGKQAKPATDPDHPALAAPGAVVPSDDGGAPTTIGAATDGGGDAPDGGTP